jgi:hypothetical protein
VAITTQEKERSDIARLLHHDVGARLSIVLMHLSNMEDRAELGASDLNEVSLTKGYVNDRVLQRIFQWNDSNGDGKIHTCIKSNF